MSARDGGAERWLERNRASWDERVPVHLGTDAYDLTPLREGRARLHPVEQRELGDVSGLRVAHLMCHFGRDSLTLAQQGATVVGVDFSRPALEAARRLADELGLAARARFVESPVYGAAAAIGEPASFDLVFMSWGVLGWLPDLPRLFSQVAALLRPGGRYYLIEGHPSAFVFDDRVEAPPGAELPGPFVPYFERAPLEIDDHRDYADPDARLEHSRTVEFQHSLETILSGVIDAGLALERFREHDSLPWAMFERLVADGDGMYRWPGRPWLPLAFSLSARRR